MVEKTNGPLPQQVSTQRSSWKDKIGKLFHREKEVTVSLGEQEKLLIDIQEALEIEGQDVQLSLNPHPEGVPADLREKYYGKKVEIEELYGRAAYWHGTGRKQYRGEEIIDILDNLMTDGGLVPRPDPFDVTKGGVVNTISLSDRRSYAAGYARMHLFEGESLGHQYMTDQFWGVFLRITAREAIGYTHIERIKKIGKFAWKHLQETKNPAYLFQLAVNLRKTAMGWTSKVTREQFRGSVGKFFTVHSDIPGNYPILIGIKEGSFTPVKSASYIDKFETRAGSPIAFAGFTHLEVPQSHLQEIQSFLDQRGVKNVPIIAMELGEIHSSQFSPQQLIQGNPFRK